MKLITYQVRRSKLLPLLENFNTVLLLCKFITQLFVPAIQSNRSAFLAYEN